MSINTKELDLNHVRAFVKLVQMGSVTKAAEYLKQPKSRLSRHLASLEKELGVQLIYRTTRQFQLTETGRIYYERCKGLVEGLESVAVEMSESSAEVSGWIRITAADDLGVNYLPKVLDEFSKLYPRICFDVILSQAYVDLVKESVDVALRIGQLRDSSLRARRIGYLRNIFVASPGFLERYKNLDNIEEVSRVPVVAMSPGNKVEVLRAGDARQKLILRLDPVAIGNNPALVAQLALQGKGLGFLPEFLCRPYLKDGRLVHLFKSWQSAEVPFNVVTPNQKEVPLRVKKFTEFAAKRLKDIFAES